jgi:hypothetical protein
MSRILALGMAVAMGMTLFVGAGGASAQASALCGAVVLTDAPLRAAPDDTALLVGTAPAGSRLFVRTPPINRYFSVVDNPPPDPPMPGMAAWIREDHILISGCYG